MNIKINSFGQVVNIQDWLLVQNANFLNTNKIILEFDESFTQEQLDNFYTARLTVDLPDGRTLNNLYMGKVVEDGKTSFIHEVDENSQIFAVKGSIGLSIVVISASNGVLATVKTRAFVQENNGISSQAEYDSAVKEIDDNYIKPFEKRTQQNFQALDSKIEAKIKDFWQLDNISAYIGDLNALTIPCTKTISPSNVSNYPNNEVGSGIIYVIKHSEQVIFQLFLENSSTANINLLTRANILGSWTEWNSFTSISKHLALEATVNDLTEYVHGLVLNSDLFIILAPGEELPEQGIANKFYLKPIADGESPNVFDEYIWVNAKWEYLGKAGITANLTDYVKFTDYATQQKAGVVKVYDIGSASNTTGIGINGNQVLVVKIATENEITNRTTTYSPITPINLNFAVKEGVTNNGITLSEPTVEMVSANNPKVTDEGEKIKACEWLGAIPKNFASTTNPSNYLKLFGCRFINQGKFENQEVPLDFQNTANYNFIPLRQKNTNIYLPKLPETGTDSTNRLYIDTLPERITLGNEDKKDEKGNITQSSKAKWLNWLGAVGYNNYPTPGTNDTAIAGVVKVRNYGWFGVYINGNGFLTIQKATDDDIKGRSNHYTPITPGNLDFAVKEGITNNSIELTKEEQESARKWLGVGVGKQIVLADLVAILTNQDHETFISLSERMVAGDCIILASYYQEDSAPIYAVPTIEGSDGVYRWRLTLATTLTTVFIVEVDGDGETLVYNQAAYDHTEFVSKDYVDDNFVSKNSTEDWTFTLEDGSTITKKVAIVAEEA